MRVFELESAKGKYYYFETDLNDKKLLNIECNNNKNISKEFKEILIKNRVEILKTWRNEYFQCRANLNATFKPIPTEKFKPKILKQLIKEFEWNDEKPPKKKQRTLAESK